ncbi:MAG: TonB-dependent receptor [Steroidobacteraceae bacterium]
MAAAISGALTCAPALSFAQEGPRTEEEVIVTATRRAESIQDVPLNIAAVSGDAIKEEGLSDLAEVARTVPGLFVVDQGARAANQIVVRGLNASSVTASEQLGNNGGGTVATYIGEIPLYVDLRPDDIERIEVLLGPQGTLYGAGTLGGAIRYIPMRPQFDATSVQVTGSGYALSHSDGFGKDVGLTANVPLGEIFAVRASVNYLDDPGFVDYNYLVRTPGVSDPEPPAGARDANLRRDKDADDEQTLSGRVAFRIKPTDALDVNLTYYFQDQETGGRTATHSRSFDTGRYEFAARYPEPNDRRNELLALEVMADLGLAELTSATGASWYKEHGGRDQTDLLLQFETGYELFPSFSAFTRETQKDESFNQELRLVSNTEGRFDWIAGAFYNKLKRRATTREFTPLYSEFLVSLDPSIGYRPDGLEYFQRDKRRLEEYALYGELTFHITDRWQVTGGVRHYKYDLDTNTDVALPLLFTSFLGAGPDEIDFGSTPGGQKHNGELFKLNTSFDLTDDVMVYATVSEGYRIGNSNGVEACEDPLPPGQNACGLPNELEYEPDTTTNYELGVRSEWLGGRLLLNGSIYRIDWDDLQVAGATLNGSVPITTNGNGARSQGFDFSFATQLTERLFIRGAYAYTNAELTEDAPNLLTQFVPPGFGSEYVDGSDGDRLPGSPKHQGSMWLTYDMPWSSAYSVRLNYGLTAQSDVLTRTGRLAGGEALGGFAVHHASASLQADHWTLSLYAKNLFNKYAFTGVRSNVRAAQALADIDGNPVRVRSYYHDILRPREVGLRFSYDFEL